MPGEKVRPFTPLILYHSTWSRQYQSPEVSRPCFLASLSNGEVLSRLADVPAILQLIRELADYEHELNSVEATEEKLLATIAFAPSPDQVPRSAETNPASETEPISAARPARCLILFDGETGEPGGIALYFYNYST